MSDALRMMHFKSTFCVTKIQTANHINRRSTEQWQTFFNASRDWIRFEFDERYGPTSDYFMLSQSDLENI